MLRFKQVITQSRQVIQRQSLYQRQISIPQLQYATQRQFAHFNTKSPLQTNKQDEIEDDAAAGRTYEDALRNAEAYKKSIREKTLQGRHLSESIGKEIDSDMFRKIQRYEIFINKMDQLFRSELRYKRKMNKKLGQMNQAHVYSLTPLKDILRHYNELSARGFNSETVAESLQCLLNGVRGRGNQAKVYGDYSINEMDQSWRMQKIIDDIKFGLRPDQFFSAHYLAKTSRVLGDLGYKNTELIPEFFKKLHNQLAESEQQEPQINHEFRFEDAVYGDRLNFIPRHYIFQGFQNSSEFKEYLQILLEWEGRPQPSQSQEQLEDTSDQIIKSMEDIISAASQLKNLQKEYQASIESLRQQYFLMQSAADKHQFIMENPYIKYDLLELQEMLIKTGYVDPQEIIDEVYIEPFESRMRRATTVFYDYALNFAPELLSPQHESFYQASLEHQKQEQKKEEVDLNDNLNQINLSYLSQSLVGLAHQALSFRRDVVGRDYLNKFYEEYLMPLEQLNTQKDYEKLKYETVMMEREYLRAWRIFKEESAKLLPEFIKLVKKDANRLDGQLQALLALSACRFDVEHLRQEIIKNALACFQSDISRVSQQALIDGLQGLAESPTIDQSGKELARKIIKKLDTTNFTFDQQLNTLWSLCNLQEYNNKVASSICEQLNRLNFERIDNDMIYDQFLKVIDIYNALQIEAPKDLKITNKPLLIAIKGQETAFDLGFREAQTHYDPFKKRVIQGLAKGLTEASVSHELIMEEELYNSKQQDIENLNTNKYPYKPDIVMGYKGTKLGVFVLPEREITHDTFKPNGSMRFKMRLVENAHKGQIKTATIAIPKIIHYDIEGLKLSLNQHFSLPHELDSQLNLKSDNQKLGDFTELSQFGAHLMKEALSFPHTIKQTKDLQKMDNFIKSLYRLFQTKQQNELRYDPIQRAAGFDDLRFQLMKLSIMYESLSKQCQEYVKQAIPPQYTSLKQMLLKTKDSFPKIQTKSSKMDRSDLNLHWQGTRLDVELPVSATENIKKSIVPEIINQRFMWVDDYFHYDDWKAKQQATFDNFNLLVIPRHKDAALNFYENEHHNRLIPQGIFPYPNHKREVLVPQSGGYAASLIKKTGHNEITLFESAPYKMMVVNELKKSQTLKPISDEVSMITNLQNVKQGLKSDYKDNEILDILLNNLTFTEQLIEEHLGSVKRKPQSGKLLPRDPDQFKQFVQSTYFTKSREDPYTDFFIKEAAKTERVHKLIADEKEKQIPEDHTKSADVIEAANQRREILADKMERMLLQNELENEDLHSLSHSLRTNVKIDYDLKSLIKSEFVYDVEPELIDQAVKSDQYLDIQRRRAEAKLIKMKIIYKLYQGQQELTSNEKAYLKHWLNDLKENKDRNIMNLRESLVPKDITSLTFGDLDAKNIYALNSITRVEIDRERHGQYSLNELILEISHFLDEEVINKVETEIFSSKMRSEWGLSEDFSAIETRNKEIGHVLNELEEVAWRTAGQFTDKDYENVKNMISINRNLDSFDKEYYEIDMKSLREFFEDINTYDNRIQHLEAWIARKEVEYKTRVNRPPAHMKRSDKEINASLDRSVKKARESLVGKFLVADEFGSPIEKDYKDLTSRELHQLAENLSLRLYLFNYDYPSFIPQAVRAIMDHPNLLKSDKDLLDTYCKMFELDWRGDKHAVLNKDFLAINPIWVEGSNLRNYGEITNERLRDMLKKACAPYVPQLTSKLLNVK